MIKHAISYPVGNAIGLVLEDDGEDSLQIRVLRRDSDAFTGPDDLSAKIVYQGPLLSVAVDLTAINGQAYFYKLYLHDGSDFADNDDDAVAGMAQSIYEDGGPDPRAIVRARLSDGFKQEILRGLLKIKAQPDNSMAVSVLNAPPVFETTKWPVVSVHERNDGPSERGIGEEVQPDVAETAEGWLARYTLDVVAWSQNPDERHALGRSLRRILQANMPVFAGLGLTRIEVNGQDADFVSGEYTAPVYCKNVTLTLEAAAYVYANRTGVKVVTINVEALPDVNGNLDTDGAC